MWTQAPVIFDNENEAELITEYVRCRAQYPNREIFEIAQYVFRNLVDPETRSMQAAMIWEKDLSITERIRIARLNGGKEPLSEAESKLQKLIKLEAIYNDESVAVKDRLKAIELHSQIQGEIVKAVDKTIDDKRAFAPRQIIYAQYSDDD